METEEAKAPHQKLQDVIDVTDKLISSMVAALETVTNLCSSSQFSDIDDEEYESCSEGSVAEGDNGMEQDGHSMIDAQLKEGIVASGIFQNVVDKAKLPTQQQLECLLQHASGFSASSTVDSCLLNYRMFSFCI